MVTCKENYNFDLMTEKVHRAGLGFISLHSGTWLSCEETLPAHASFETQERDHNSSR